MAPPDPAELFADRRGVVAAFDDHVGAGTITDDATGTTWSFHCTRIVDGTRTIPVGAMVTFRASLGPVGAEAVDVAR